MGILLPTRKLEALYRRIVQYLLCSFSEAVATSSQYGGLNGHYCQIIHMVVVSPNYVEYKYTHLDLFTRMGE